MSPKTDIPLLQHGRTTVPLPEPPRCMCQCFFYASQTRRIGTKSSFIMKLPGVMLLQSLGEQFPVTDRAKHDISPATVSDVKVL